MRRRTGNAACATSGAAMMPGRRALDTNALARESRKRLFPAGNLASATTDTMLQIARALTRSTVTVAAVACAVLLAACGSSHKPHAAAASDHALGVKYATCMRDHGVSSFPDPETGAGIQIPVSLAQDPSPAFKTATKACQYLVPADTGPPAVSASQKAAAVKLAQCMREHGVPNYPDPTYKDGHEIPPSIADPAINPASPAFGDASKACQSP
jgi:hypothetical protein